MSCQEGAARETEESRAISKWSEGCGQGGGAEQGRAPGCRGNRGSQHKGSEALKGSGIQGRLLEREKRLETSFCYTGGEDLRASTGLLCPGPLYICRIPTRPPALPISHSLSCWTILSSCPSRALESKVMPLSIALVQVTGLKKAVQGKDPYLIPGQELISALKESHSSGLPKY